MSDNDNDNSGHAAIDKYVSHLLQGGQRKSSDELLHSMLDVGAAVVPEAELPIAVIKAGMAAKSQDDDED